VSPLSRDNYQREGSDSVICFYTAATANLGNGGGEAVGRFLLPSDLKIKIERVYLETHTYD